MIAYETNSVAPEETLACSGGPGENHSSSQVPPRSPEVVAERAQCVEGAIIASSSSRSSIVYRCLKQRLGRSLRGSHGKRPVTTYFVSTTYFVLPDLFRINF